MDSSNYAVGERDPTGSYIRYDELIGSGNALLKQYKAFDQNQGVEVTWSQASICDGLLSPNQVQLLCQEINLLKQLKHGNIARFHDSWIDGKNKRINMITESFASGSLREYRSKHKKIGIKVIKNWGSQILKGMHYLHTLNPPLLLPDLACDQVFVNGNNGHVKISTISRLLAILNNNKQYLEVVQKNQHRDKYCFGMCMLELSNPASFSGVFDVQARDFIEKCLSMRFSAIELLKHPFLMENKSLPRVASSEKNKYGLEGLKIDEKTISFTLDVVTKASGVTNKIEFPFYVDSDTSVSVAEKMIQQLDFSSEDVAIVGALIDALLIEFVGRTNTNSIDSKTFNNNSLDKESQRSSKFGRDQPKETRENPDPELILFNNRDDKLKMQLDAIDMRYVKSFQQILNKNLAF